MFCTQTSVHIRMDGLHTNVCAYTDGHTPTSGRNVTTPDLAVPRPDLAEPRPSLM